MAIQINMTVMYRRSRLSRLKAFVSNPFTKPFMQSVRKKFKENIRDIGGERSLPYHTYPSSHQGQLEQQSYVENMGGGELIIGSFTPYAEVFEFGRRRMKRTKNPFVFQGYYPNPAIVSSILRRTQPKWMEQAVPEFSSTTPLGAKMFSRYNPNLKGKSMRTQNLRFIVGQLRGEIAELHWSGNGRILTEMKRAGEKSVVAVGRKKVSLAKMARIIYPFGIYTVFAYNLKEIAPYHVFTKTAEWAKDELEKTARREVRDIDVST